MKKLTIGLIALTLAAATIACKKKKNQYCFWIADGPGNTDYVWEYTKPTDAQLKKFTDSCGCTFTLKEVCQNCKTDSAGNDFDCY